MTNKVICVDLLEKHVLPGLDEFNGPDDYARGIRDAVENIRAWINSGRLSPSPAPAESASDGELLVQAGAVEECLQLIDKAFTLGELRVALNKLRATLAARAPSAQWLPMDERIAQITAHRACGNQEHDPQAGKLSGYCVVCQIPWPCQYSGPTPTTNTREGM